MWKQITLNSCMLIIISLMLLSAALYIILSGGYNETTVNWAYGIIASILALWLRGETIISTPAEKIKIPQSQQPELHYRPSHTQNVESGINDTCARANLIKKRGRRDLR